MKRPTQFTRAVVRIIAPLLIVGVASCSAASADDSRAAASTVPVTSDRVVTTPETTHPAVVVPPSPTESTEASTGTETETGSTGTGPGNTDTDDTDYTSNTDGSDDSGGTGPQVTDATRPTHSTIGGPTSTTVPAPPVTSEAPSLLDPSLPNLAMAFNSLIDRNAAVSVTVWRDHSKVFGKAAGAGAGGEPVRPGTPMVLASVSKLITALTVTRLAEVGAITVDAPVPWDSMNIAHDPAWNDVTVRELLDHTSGMPKAQNSWLNDPGSCAIPLTAAMAGPPTVSRGKWLYSNGNYCALGLLIEAVTGVDRGTAARVFVFDPIDVSGPHLTTDGVLPGDGPYAKDIARLDRLGGAGTWMAGSADLAAMLDSVTPDDLTTMTYPAIMIDQYGWGHTGTVDGAKACAWVMEQGRTVVVGIVAGDRPSTGGGVCDVLVPALAADLGVWADKPHRLPE